ncbi:hypothetical protein [Pseudodesulfovibrio indicus]|uniref:hypothetical protein n=1 Tax=Pseudodesulfovibrio indicus TaxID=1716143 RepID=UPI00292CF411|nr:hypothetical protein [Pseudodesulfovibrio indicus]
MSIPNVGEIKAALIALSDLVKKGMTVEAQEKIMGLREMLLELREQNIEYKEKIILLEKQVDLDNRLVFRNNVLWLKEDSEESGPFCQPCWDARHQLIRLQIEKYFFRCKVCEDTVQHTSPPSFSKSSRLL